jgi:phosphoribosylformylglycinamidine synthase subunit PurL
VPVTALVDDCPLYDLDPQAPESPASLYPPPAATSTAAEPSAVLLDLLGSPNLASRRPLYQQYDWLVQSRTVRRPDEADAAVLALPGGGALAVSIDGNGRRVACDPHRGTMEAVFECAANLACVGAEPLGLTNCLNFGNPEKPHVAWQLERAVAGLGDACRALRVPVVGGNVSLYNEGPEGPIYPTPVVGMVGELPDAERAGRSGWARPGDAVALVGRPFLPSLAGSELAKLRGEPLSDHLGEWEAASVVEAIAAVRNAVRAGTVRSAHDVAEGGFATALAECCLAGGVGVRIDTGPADDPEALLFGEGPGAFVLSGDGEALEALGERLDVFVCGEVGGDRLDVAMPPARISLALDELDEAHAGGLARFFP